MPPKGWRKNKVSAPVEPGTVEAIAAYREAKAATDPVAAGAKELLERVAARTEATAAEPSGIDSVVDYDFLTADTYDPGKRLERRGLKADAGVRYHWINRDPRRVERRLNQGWQPTAGGSIVHGDSMLAQMPEARAKRLDQGLAEKRALAKNAYLDQINAEGRRTGMETFDGNKSLREGLD